METCIRSENESEITDYEILHNSRELTNQIEQFMIPFRYRCFPNSKKSLRREGYKWSRQYYNEYKDDRTDWRTLESGLKVKYESAKKPGKRLAKGPAFKLNMVNFYRTRLCVPNIINSDKNEIVVYRFGTPIHCNPKTQIKQVISEFGTRKRTIYISLLSDCNGALCDVFPILKSISTAGYNSRVKEPMIVKEEYEQLTKLPNYSPIFLQLSGLKRGNSKTVRKLIGLNPVNLKPMLNLWTAEEFGMTRDLDLNTTNPEKLFRVIVDIAAIYFMLNFIGKYKPGYQMTIHCKSGRDRTGLVDAIVKATHEFLFFNRGQIDYDVIKERVSYWILYGLVIANRSTGGFGLKLDYVPLARYVFSKERLNYLRGNVYRF